MSDREPLLPTHVNVNARDVRRASQQLLPTVTRILGALSAGKLPTNAQAVNLLQAVLNSSVLEPSHTASLLDRSGRVGSRLSEDGERVVSDIREALEATIGVAMEKNDDDKIQKFLYEISQADLDVNLDKVQTDAAPSQREVKADAEQARAAVQKLGRLVISSPAFRSLFSDAILSARDLFADAAEGAARLAENAAAQAKSAADQARPSESERADGVDLPSRKELKKKGREAQTKAKGAAREAQTQVDDATAKAKNFVDESAPEDVADAALERLKKLIVSVQKDETYKSSMSTLVDLVKKYSSIAEQAVDQAANGADQAIDADEHTKEALTQLRAIIETIAGGKSLDDFFSKFDSVVKDVTSNDQLKQLWDDVAKYLDRLLFDPGYVTSQKASRKFEELYNRSQEIAKSNADYKKDFDALVEELQAYGDAVQNDKAFNRLGQAFENLNDDVVDFQRVGFSALKSESKGVAKDVWNVLVPRALSLIREIPLPRVEFKSADYDIAIDNVVFESASFIPDLTRIINHNDLTFERGYASFASNFDSSLSLVVRGLRIHAREISYYIAKKTGVFTFEDSGLADVHLGFGSDDGLHFRIKLEKADEEDRQFFFKVANVEVELENFQVYFRQTSHSFLLWLFHGAIRSAVEKQLQDALAEQIKSAIEKSDVALFALQQRATAAGQAATTPADYARALFTPSSSTSSGGPIKLASTGIVKSGPHGEWVLAIGVDEQILPGRTTAKPSRAGYSIDEDDVEQGLQQVRGVVRQAKQAAGEAQEQSERAMRETERQRKRELREKGWQSKAFDV